MGAIVLEYETAGKKKEFWIGENFFGHIEDAIHRARTENKVVRVNLEEIRSKAFERYKKRYGGGLRGIIKSISELESFHVEEKEKLW